MARGTAACIVSQPGSWKPLAGCHGGWAQSGGLSPKPMTAGTGDPHPPRTFFCWGGGAAGQTGWSQLWQIGNKGLHLPSAPAVRQIGCAQLRQKMDNGPGQWGRGSGCGLGFHEKVIARSPFQGLSSWGCPGLRAPRPAQLLERLALAAVKPRGTPCKLQHPS